MNKDVSSSEICLRTDNGQVLMANGRVRKHLDREARVVERLAVAPCLYTSAKRVLVFGGEDGLVLERLLRFEELEQVILVPELAALCEFSKTNKVVTRLNLNSLDDSRVKISPLTPKEFLSSGDDLFDVVISDLPFCTAQELDNYYCDEFFLHIADLLSAQGVFHLRTGFSRVWFGILSQTLRSVYSAVHLAKKSLGEFEVGFHLAAKSALKRTRDIPQWCNYLNEEVLSGSECFDREERRIFSDALVNSPEQPCLATDVLRERFFCDSDYRYDENTICVEERAFKTKLSDMQLAEVLSVLLRTKNVVIKFSAERSLLIEHLKELGFKESGEFLQVHLDCLDDRQVTSMRKLVAALPEKKIVSCYEFYSGKASEHPGLLALVQDYFDYTLENSLRNLAKRELFLDDLADYHYVEDLNGNPAGFLKVIETAQGRVGEIAYGIGNSRVNTYLLVRAFIEETALGISELRVNVPNSSFSDVFGHMSLEGDSGVVVMTCSSLRGR